MLRFHASRNPGFHLSTRSLVRCTVVVGMGCLLLTSGLAQDQSDSRKTNPTTRQESLRQQRLEKAKTTTAAAKRPFWEKYLLSFDQKGNDSIEDSNFWGFYPRVDWIARNSGIAVGLRYWKPNLVRRADFLAAAYYSYKQYQHYEMSFGLIPTYGRRLPSIAFESERIDELSSEDLERTSKFRLYANALYRFQPQIRYYGTGADSQQEDETNFLRKDLQLELVTGYQFNKRVAWTTATGVLQHSLGPGRGSSPSTEDLFDDTTAPGLDTPPNYFLVRNNVLVDFRDDPRVPHSGFLMAAIFNIHRDIGATDSFAFNRLGLDARAFIPLGHRQRVIALRTLLVRDIAKDGNRVPFFLQASLGGSRTLRGYDSFRFRGERLMLYQAEYRWEASPRIEFALFGDTGTVATGEPLSFDRLRSNWGFGFRLKSSRSTLLRIDQAWSNEGWRIHFRVSAVF